MRKTHPAVAAGLSVAFIVAAGAGVAVSVDTLFDKTLPEAEATYADDVNIDPEHRVAISTDWIANVPSETDTKTRYIWPRDDEGSYFTRDGTFTIKALRHTGPFEMEIQCPKTWTNRGGKFNPDQHLISVTGTGVGNTENSVVTARVMDNRTTIKITAENGGLEADQTIVVRFQLITDKWTPTYSRVTDSENFEAEYQAVASELDGYQLPGGTSLPAKLEEYATTSGLTDDDWEDFREMVQTYVTANPTSYGNGSTYPAFPNADLEFKSPQYGEDYSKPQISMVSNAGASMQISPGQESGWITFEAKVDGNENEWHSCKNVNIPVPTLAMASGTGTVPSSVQLVLSPENANGFIVRRAGSNESQNVPFGTGSVDLSSGDTITFKYKIVANANMPNPENDIKVYSPIVVNVGGQTGNPPSIKPNAINLSSSDPIPSFYRETGTVTISSIKLTHDIILSDQYPSLGDTIDCRVRIQPTHFMASGRIKVGLVPFSAQLAPAMQTYGVKFLSPTSLPTGVSVPSGGINSAGNEIILNLTNISADDWTEIRIPIQVATSTATGIYNKFGSGLSNSISVKAVALPLNEANNISGASYVSPETQFLIQSADITAKTSVRDLSLDIATGDTQKLVMNLGDRAKFRVVYSPTFPESAAVTKNVSVSDSLSATAAGATSPLAANVAGIRIFSYTDPNTGENPDEKDLIAKSNPKLMKINSANQHEEEIPATFTVVNNGTEDRITATPKQSINIKPGESLILEYSADLGSVMNPESQIKMRGATVTNAPEVFADNIGGRTMGTASVEIASAQIKSFLTPSTKEAYIGESVNYAMIIQCVPPEGARTTGSAYAKGLHATVMLDEYAYQNGLDYGFDSIRLYRIVDGVARLLPDYTYNITPGGADSETGENQFTVDLRSRYADSYRIKMVDKAYGSAETEPSMIAYDVRDGFVITFTTFTDRMKEVLGDLSVTTDAAARADNAGYATTQTDVTIKGRPAGAPTILPVSGPTDGTSTFGGGGTGSGTSSGNGTTGGGTGSGTGSGTSGSGASKGTGPLITTDASAPAVATGILGGIIAWWAIRRQRNSRR